MSGTKHMPGYFHKTVGGTDSYGMFSFTKLIDPSTEDFSEVSKENRCDTLSSVGPTGFHQWSEENEACSCGSLDRPYKLTGNHHITFPRLKMLTKVIDIRPYTIIMYMELKDPVDEVATIEGLHTANSRTLQELFRLMYEWKYAHDHLGSREPMATTCAGAINILDIPMEIEQWIVNEMPPEKVGRYLNGSDSARVRNTDIPDLPDFFSEWLHDKINTTRETITYG